ncbi:hypothetical protein D8I35_15815 [Corticibacter populi]|uniref:Uncharacterized protein n=1 Tax=Corticibacter populi TaxID=1550736 RepID=A0A3M6QMF1_9BURK|nr:hypothetical protein [Corticibacter populi]RMX04253.1 hypothetical protein D8I35_15815 [Corticibacter populi]RZS33295.1 hypothetical protein EV687_1617 [Corticibacter populi]
MSILGEAGSAAQTLTEKATGNPLGKALDALAGGLAGSGGSAAAGTPRFVQAGPVGQAQRVSAFALQSITKGMPPPKTDLTLQIDRQLQFLHLCHAHRAEPGDFPGGATAQGTAMRDALVREAVLLHSFVRGTQNVLAKVKASKGAAGAMLDTAAALAGGSTQAAPGPEAFDALLASIRAAIDPVNQAGFGYPAIHAAGEALGQTADAYHAQCKPALQAGQGGGAGLPSIPGLSNALGKAGVPKVIEKVPQWLFKVQDAYLALHAATREAYEWPLMKISHDYSLQAIRGRWQPSYDIWRLRNHEATEAAVQDDPSLAENLLGNGIGMLEDKPINNRYGFSDIPGQGRDANGDPEDGSVIASLQKAQGAIADKRHDAQDKMADLVGLLATARDAQADMPPEAVAALARACALLRGAGQQGDAKSAGLPPLGEVIASALGQSLCSGNLPDFMRWWCGRMGGITTDLLEGVLQAVHGSASGPHPVVVLTAVHHTLADQLVGLLFELVTGRKPGENDMGAQQQDARSAVDDLGQLDVDAAFRKARTLVPDKDQASNRAADLLGQFLAGQGRHLDGIVFFVASELHEELLDAWMETRGKNAMSMEAYLGRLPMLAATLARNLIFPVFNLLLKAFGLGDKLAGAVWDPVSQGIGRVADAVQTAKQTKDDINQAGKDIRGASERVDEQLFGDDENSTMNRLDGHRKNLSSVDQTDAAEGFDSKDKQLGDLVTDLKNTPDDVARAAKGEPDAPAAGAGAGAGSGPAGKANGPLSAMRESAAQAQPVTKAQLDGVRTLAAMAEADFLRLRKATTPAQPPPPGSPAPDLPGF